MTQNIISFSSFFSLLLFYEHFTGHKFPVSRWRISEESVVRLHRQSAVPFCIRKIDVGRVAAGEEWVHFRCPKDHASL